MLISLLAVLIMLMTVQMPKTFPKAIMQNWLRVRIARAWMSVGLVEMEVDDALQDGIPDGWNVHWWGGARAIYRLECQEALAGDHAARVERTNDQGVASLVQDIAVSPDSHLFCTVYAKGAGGAVQFQFRTKETGDREAYGWCDIAPSEDWQKYRLSVTVPPGKNEARLLLRSRELTWFDEAYVGVESDGQLGPNLLRNPGFEQDGVSEDPLEWWQTHIIQPDALSIPEGRMPERLSYLNIIDMLAGRYDALRERSQQLGDRCASAPGMTSWLIARGDDFEREGGEAARERLYQLALELAPNCPEPYAALAGLYRSHHAFGRATELYHQATERSGETMLAGRYSFAEGFLHIRYTGDTERAIPALQQAEQLSGWEGGDWYWGAASLFLGQALEAEGRIEEAAAAYRRVIECEQCSYHHTAALNRLKALSASSSDQ